MFSFVFLRSLWPHTPLTVVFQYLIVVFIYFFCYIIYIFLQSYVVLFLLSPLCLSISVSGYTKFVVSHHWCYQHSAQKFDRKLNNFLSSDKKKKRCNLQSNPFSTRDGFENKDNIHLISAKQHRKRLRFFYAYIIKKKYSHRVYGSCP